MGLIVLEKGTGRASFTRATSLPWRASPVKEGCWMVRTTATEMEPRGREYSAASPSWTLRSCRLAELGGKQRGHGGLRGWRLVAWLYPASSTGMGAWR